MKNSNLIIPFIFTLFLVSCANLSSNSDNKNRGELPENPKEIKISWNKNGGMLPERTQIYISNDSCSYLSSKQQVEQLVEYKVSTDELKSLYDVFYTNQFNKIQTYKEEIYDRGGSSISLSVDTQSFNVSNSGMTLIKENNKAQYAAIEKAILNLNKTYVNKQKQTVSINLDTSITDYKDIVVFYVNDNVEYSEDKNGEYFLLELDLLPMNNKFEIYFMNNSESKSYLTMDVKFEVLLEQLPENNKVLLTLDGDQLIIK